MPNQKTKPPKFEYRFALVSPEGDRRSPVYTVVQSHRNNIDEVHVNLIKEGVHWPYHVTLHDKGDLHIKQNGRKHPVSKMDMTQPVIPFACVAIDLNFQNTNMIEFDDVRGKTAFEGSSVDLIKTRPRMDMVAVYTFLLFKEKNLSGFSFAQAFASFKYVLPPNSNFVPPGMKWNVGAKGQEAYGLGVVGQEMAISLADMNWQAEVVGATKEELDMTVMQATHIHNIALEMSGVKYTVPCLKTYYPRLKKAD